MEETKREGGKGKKIEKIRETSTKEREGKEWERTEEKRRTKRINVDRK
jgi:hypothetical protein